MIRNNQKGFSAVEILIVTVAIGLIGAMGYFVYQRTQSNKAAPAEANTTADQTTAPQTDDEQKSTEERTYKGTRYASSKGAFSMELLNGWTVEQDTTYDYFFQYDTEKLEYDASKKPVIKTTDSSGAGGFIPGIKISVNKHNEAITKGDSFELDDGTTGICVQDVTTHKQDVNDLMRENVGNFISKNCYFKKGSLKMSASYSYYEKEPIDIKAIEAAFKTIQFEK